MIASRRFTSRAVVACLIVSLALLAIWRWLATAYNFAFWYVAGGALFAWLRMFRYWLAPAEAPVLPLREQTAKARERARDRLSSIGELGGAILPIAFLFVVAGTFASAGLPAWEQLFIGLAAGVVSWLIVFEERGRDEELAGWARRLVEDVPVIGSAIVVAVGAGAVVTLIISRAAPRWIDRLQEIGGNATLVAYLALAAALIGILIRLFAFVTSARRAFAVAAVVLIAIHRLMWLGTLPGFSASRHIKWWVDVVIAVGCIGLLLTDARRGPQFASARSSGASTRRKRAWWYGFATVISAAVALLVAVPYGVLGSTDYSPSAAGTFGQIEPGTEAHLLARTDRQLATTFAPVLQLTTKERWALTDVDAYLKDAAVYATTGPHSYLVKQEPVIEHPTRRTLPMACPDTGSLCYTISCRAGEGTCQYPRTHRAGSYREGTEYVRIVRRRTNSGFFKSVTPYGARLRVVLQYWLFYRYDRWLATTFAGNFDQQHEGDWEAVTVGLGANDPLFVAYSEHCGGNWYPWSKVQVAPFAFSHGVWTTIDSAKTAALHPLVGVAQGSHANYIRAQDQRAPDWSSCGAHVSDAAANALSYVWNIRDRTANGWLLFPGRLAYVDEHTPPMSFPGFWGEAETISLRNFRNPSLPIEARGDGPKSPPKQPLWYATLATIFCSAHWHPEKCR
jgi:hypothetical protein